MEEKLPYEELEKRFNELKSAQIGFNSVVTRLQFDFLVLENHTLFPDDYKSLVVKDIMKLLPMDGYEVESAVLPLPQKVKTGSKKK